MSAIVYADIEERFVALAAETLEFGLADSFLYEVGRAIAATHTDKQRAVLDKILDALRAAKDEDLPGLVRKLETLNNFVIRSAQVKAANAPQG